MPCMQYDAQPAVRPRSCHRPISTSSDLKAFMGESTMEMLNLFNCHVWLPAWLKIDHNIRSYRFIFEFGIVIDELLSWPTKTKNQYHTFKPCPIVAGSPRIGPKYAGKYQKKLPVVQVFWISFQVWGNISWSQSGVAKCSSDDRIIPHETQTPFVILVY